MPRGGARGEEDFDEHRRAVPGLSRLVHELTHGGFPVAGDTEEAVIGRVAACAKESEGDANARHVTYRDHVASMSNRRVLR